MGSKSPGTQTVTNKTEPDPLTDQWRTTIANQAQGLMNQGSPPYYPGQTVVPFSNQTQMALDYMQNQAMQGAPLQGQAYNAAGRMMSGFTPGMGVAMGAAMGGMDAQTGFNPFTSDVRASGMTDLGGGFSGAFGAFSGGNPFVRGVANAGRQAVAGQLAPGFAQQQAGFNPFVRGVANAGRQAVAGQLAPGFAQQQAGFNPFTQDVRASGMTNTAGQIAPQALNAGSFNPFMTPSAMSGMQQTQMGVGQLQDMAQGGSNPQLDALFNRGANQMRNQVDAMFARSGMTGTAAHQGEFQEGLGDLFANTYGQAYETDRNRQMAAAGQLANIDQGNRAAAMQGFGQAGQMFGASQGLGLEGLGLYNQAMQGDAARNMDAAQAAGGLFENAQGRGLSALNAFGGFLSDDAQRNLAAQQSAGGLFENAQGRGLSALNAFGGFLSDDAQRNLAAQQGAGGLFEGAQQRGLGALNDLAGLYGADADRNMAGAQSAAQLSQADFARLLQAQGMNADTRLAGAQLAGNMWDSGNQNALRGIAALPEIYDYGMAPARTLGSIGSGYEDMAGRYLEDDMARYDYANDSGWRNLSRYADMVNGLPTYGTDSQTSPRQRTNPAMGALSGMSAGAGIFSALGKAGLAAIPGLGWGALGVGGLLGLLGSR